MFSKEEVAWLKFGVKIGVFSGLLIGVGIGFYFTEPRINQLFGLIAAGMGIITLIGAFARVRGVTIDDLKNMTVQIKRYA